MKNPTQAQIHKLGLVPCRFCKKDYINNKEQTCHNCLPEHKCMKCGRTWRSKAMNSYCAKHRERRAQSRRVSDEFAAF